MEIYDEDDSVVYIYYLDNRLYAWTNQKKDKAMFEEQRNVDVFRRKKKTLSPIQFHVFMQKYKSYQIIEIPVSSKGKDFSIFGTYYEDEELTSLSEHLLSEFEQLDIYFTSIFHNDLLPGKYKNAVNTLLDYCSINSKTKINEFHIDSLSMFYTLFKHTF